MPGLNPGLRRSVAKRARHDLPAVQDKRAQVVELRAQGRTWDQIAAATGYSNGSAASKAWRAAIQQRPDQTVDEIRRAERERLDQMDSRLSDIISSPPIKTTAIGRVQWDPRTCTCGVKGDTKRDHADSCDVLPVLDEALIVAAVRERRAIGESVRRLVGADAPPKVPVFDEEHLRMAAEITVIQRIRGNQAPLPALGALPGNYHALSPAEQARADLERRRPVLQAQAAAIAALPADQDDDVTDAEVIDD